MLAFQASNSQPEASGRRVLCRVRHVGSSHAHRSRARTLVWSLWFNHQIRGRTDFCGQSSENQLLGCLALARRTCCLSWIACLSSWLPGEVSRLRQMPTPSCLLSPPTATQEVSCGQLLVLRKTGLKSCEHWNPSKCFACILGVMSHPGSQSRSSRLQALSQHQTKIPSSI